MSGHGGNQTRRRGSYHTTREDGLMPEVRLIVAILARAGLDTLNGSYYAARFIQSKDFENYCQWIGVDADKLRERLNAARKGGNQ